MDDLLSKWKTSAWRILWPEEIESLPLWKALLTRMLQVSFVVIRDFLDGQLTLRAMSLVYTTLLSLVPLLALTFSVLKGFGIHNQLEPLLLSTLAPLGDKGVQIAKQIVTFVENIKVGVLGSLGLGMLIYTVISLLHKIEKSFNFIWHIDLARPFGQRFSEYLSVLLVGPLLIFSALGITASLMSSTAVKTLSVLPGLGFVIHYIGELIPYTLVVVAFTFLYVFIPNTRVRILPALIGGAVAGIAWETTGWAFGKFIVNSGNYTAIYSGFAILIMFMIWVFVSWLVLLLGTSIAFYCQHPEHLGMRRGQPELSAHMAERLALLIMLFIGQRYYRRQITWQLDELARWLGVPLNVAEIVLNRLHARQLILHTDEGTPPYVPAQDMDTLQVKQILDAIRAGDDEGGTTHWRLPRDPVIEQTIKAKDDAIEQAVGNQTLKELVLAGEGESLQQHDASESTH